MPVPAYGFWIVARDLLCQCRNAFERGTEALQGNLEGDRLAWAQCRRGDIDVGASLESCNLLGIKADWSEATLRQAGGEGQI